MGLLGFGYLDFCDLVVGVAVKVQLGDLFALKCFHALSLRCSLIKEKRLILSFRICVHFFVYVYELVEAGIHSARSK